MLNPNMLFYLQSQSYYCLGRIIGIAMRCCVPLHFDLPIWIWILVSKMSKFKKLAIPNGRNGDFCLKAFDVEAHLRYLQQFDLTMFQSLDSIRNLDSATMYEQLLEMLDAASMLGLHRRSMTAQEMVTKYPFQNRMELVRDVLIHYLYTRFQGQVHAMVSGLSEVVPLNALTLFSAPQLVEEICGSSTIDLSLLKEHSVYRDGLSLNTELIQNLWDVVLNLSDELKPKFVDFVYAQKRLPSKQEFIRKNLRLQISVLNANNPDQTLPRSQTCFLNLQIPQYTTRESLQRNFIKALSSASGFYKESSE